MSTEQEKHMRDYHRYQDKVAELEEKIRQANDEGRNGNAMYGRQLDEAKSIARTCYELATDRGY